MLNKLQILRRISPKSSAILENMSYMTLLQIFLMLAPLVTYPYLVRVLGQETYGFVLTAQMLASYFSLIIDYGSNSVCAKHVSMHRDNKEMLSRIVCSVFYTRALIWLIGFVIYMMLVILLPNYRTHFTLFILTYAMTLNELLFPQYFYQGIEKMKFTALSNFAIKLIFIILVFVLVKKPDDYIYVPILYAIGYSLAGMVALFVIFFNMKIEWTKPDMTMIKYLFKESMPIFATDVMCTIKDKFNYLLLGSMTGMANVVTYDLALKLSNILQQPFTIFKTVTFPQCAQNRNIPQIKRWIAYGFLGTVFLVVAANIALPWIVHFFMGNATVDLLPIRLFLLSPIILSLSVPLCSNICIALGYNKYVFYSICITTAVYLVTLLGLFFTGKLNNIYAFIALALVSYGVELIYRLIIARKIIYKESEVSHE